jgi:hypothetical protein
MIVSAEEMKEGQSRGDHAQSLELTPEWRWRQRLHQ